MNKGMIAAVVIAALAAAGGYWAGQRQAAAGGAGTGTEPATGQAARKLLYYRNPMGLPDTSPVPKKDPMGMDYLPVYEGEADAEPAAAGQIRISSEKIQKLGVRTEAATLRPLDRVVRAAGRVEPDERRSFAIAPKFEGYVERLLVNATGQAVAKGQPLFEVYSPELVSAQREYAIASQGMAALRAADAESQSGMRQLAEASLARLKNWDISEDQIRALARSGESRRSLSFRSPVAGIVTEKKAVQGMRFMPGEALYQVTDLSSVWVIADVFEQDIGLVKSGARARVRINAYPDKVFEGSIAYVYPTLKADTRTLPVRIELPNPGHLLKPGMFAQVELPASGGGPVLTVPTAAVIDSGSRRIVLVQAGEGRFEPREVRLGARSDERVEVLAGIREGEQVVSAANFLIDAESNLKAAVSGFGQGAAATPSSPSSPSSPFTPFTPSTPARPAAASVGHQAEGRVEELDVRAGTVSVTHGPVASLNWPGMTMEFAVANPALLKDLQPGAGIAFEFVERGKGEWVITSVKALGAPAAKAPAASGHRH